MADDIGFTPDAGADVGFQSDAPAPAPESFLGGVAKNLNPMPLLQAIKEGNDTAVQQHPLANALLGPGVVTAYEAGKKILPGIIQAAKDQWQKAKDAYDEGSYSEAAGHALAAAIPGVGPAAANAGEQIGSGNIAGGLGEATGLMAPFVAGDVANAAKQGVQAVGLPEALENSATRQYSSALNATTRGNKLRSAQITPELIDQGVTGSVKSIAQQAAAKLGQIGDQLTDAYSNLPAGTSIPLKAVQDKINAAAEDAFTVPTSGGPVSASPVADAGMNHAAEINNRLLAVSDIDPTTGERVIPVDTARQLRQYYDSVAQQAGRYDGKALADQSAAAAHGMAADAIRQELSNTFPDIAKINKQYSFWKNVQQVTQDTLTRRQGQASTPLSQQIGRGAGELVGGTMGGPVGAVVGGTIGSRITQMLNSGVMKTTSAVLKDRIAQSLASGNPAAAEFYLQKAMQAAPAARAASGATATAPAALPLPAAASGNQEQQ
jgi:hypothetical protein